MKRRDGDSSGKAHPMSPNEPAQVPPGRSIELRGRGTTFVRELPGPPGAPTLILLHAVAATGGLNWFRVFEPLGRLFRVLAVDHRGHGRGLRSRDRFCFEHSADDIAAVADKLRVDSAILAGYSMGGPIAQLTWERHPKLVEGLVLCATSYRFVHATQLRLLVTSAIGAIAQATRVAEIASRVPLAGARLLLPTLVPASGSLGRWGAGEMRRHDLRAVIEAILEIGSYNAESWIGDIDVPTAVVLTARDRAVSPIWQLRLARAIGSATLHTVNDGHMASSYSPFADVFVEACTDVAARAADRRKVETPDLLVENPAGAVAR
jgi:3-oxoadipate enol-lactonase